MKGIPIADDMDKGMYFVNTAGAVMLASPNIPAGQTEVAPNITLFGGFEAHPDPPGEIA